MYQSFRSAYSDVGNFVGNAKWGEQSSPYHGKNSRPCEQGLVVNPLTGRCDDPSKKMVNCDGCSLIFKGNNMNAPYSCGKIIVTRDNTGCEVQKVIPCDNECCNMPLGYYGSRLTDRSQGTWRTSPTDGSFYMNVKGRQVCMRQNMEGDMIESPESFCAGASLDYQQRQRTNSRISLNGQNNISLRYGDPR